MKFHSLLIVLTLLFVSPVVAEEYSHYYSVARDTSGAVISGATVAVYEAGTTTLVPIYSNMSGTLKGNPFSSDGTGAFSFYAQPGLYKIAVTSVSGGFTIDNIAIGTQLHGTAHEDGESDEIDVTGLSGVLTDAQPVDVLIDGVSEGDLPGIDFLTTGDILVTFDDGVILSVKDGTVTTSKIVDGTITTDDIDAAAGIEESKLALNFPSHDNLNDPTAGQKSALAGTAGTPGGANRYVTDSDARMTNARTPTTHAASHELLGADELEIDWSQLDNVPTEFSPDLHATTHEDGGGDELDLTGLDGELADPQKVSVYKDGVLVSEARSGINFTEGGGQILTVTDNPGNDSVDVQIDNIASFLAINDLTDVDTTGVAEDDVLTYDGTNWVPEPGVVGFSDVDAGTNTDALQIGTGGSLKKASGSSGTIDATGIDEDGDGVLNISISGSNINFDPDDDGVIEASIDSNGTASFGSVTVNSVSIGNEGSLAGPSNSLGLNLSSDGMSAPGVRVSSTSTSAVNRMTHGFITDNSDRPTMMFCPRSNSSCNRTTSAASVPWGTAIRYDESAAALWVTDGSLASPASAPIAASYVTVGGLSGCRIYGSQPSPPSSPSACWQYYDTTSNELCTYDGSTWNCGGDPNLEAFSDMSTNTANQVKIDGPIDNSVVVGDGYFSVNPEAIPAPPFVSWSAETYSIAGAAGRRLTNAVDMDNDGDYEYCVGGDDGDVYCSRNTGSASVPSLAYYSSYNISTSGNTNACGAFGDMDNDGDMDFMLGVNAGNVKGIKNTGTPFAATWSVEATWHTSDIGTNACASLGDLDGDGDLDMMVGEQGGAVYGYENTGTVSVPAWTLKPAWDLADIGANTIPRLVDFDGDGDLDMFVGESVGRAYGYQNTGSASSPTWTAESSWNTPDDGSSAPGVVLWDFDIDGDIDLVQNPANSGTHIDYENTTGPSASILLEANVGSIPVLQVRNDKTTFPDQYRVCLGQDCSVYIKTNDALNDVVRFVTGTASGQFQFFAGDQDGTEASSDLTITSTTTVSTNPIYAPDGSASTPAYGFYATGSIGLYRTGGNKYVMRNSGGLGIELYTDNGPVVLGTGTEGGTNGISTARSGTGNMWDLPRFTTLPTCGTAYEGMALDTDGDVCFCSAATGVWEDKNQAGNGCGTNTVQDLMLSANFTTDSLTEVPITGLQIYLPPGKYHFDSLVFVDGSDTVDGAFLGMNGTVTSSFVQCYYSSSTGGNPLTIDGTGTLETAFSTCDSADIFGSLEAVRFSGQIIVTVAGTIGPTAAKYVEGEVHVKPGSWFKATPFN